MQVRAWIPGCGAEMAMRGQGVSSLQWLAFEVQQSTGDLGVEWGEDDWRCRVKRTTGFSRNADDELQHGLQAGLSPGLINHVSPSVFNSLCPLALVTKVGLETS